MKKIVISKLIRELKSYNVDGTTIELIRNNTKMLNDLIDRYNDGKIGRDLYLMFQLNSIVVKQLAEQKKNFEKVKPEIANDPFETLIENMNKKVEKR